MPTTLATVTEFYDRFSSDEAIDLTNLDDPDSLFVQKGKIQNRLDDAAAELCGELRLAESELPVWLAAALKPHVLAVARKRLAYYQDPNDVREVDYEKAIEFCRKYREELNDDASGGVDDPAAPDPISIMSLIVS